MVLKNEQYYNGAKLLSMKDINGKKPELFICTTNRTAGKTTYFSRLCVNKFIQKRQKFTLLYRFNYEIDDVSDKFFTDISKLFFQDYSMTSKRMASGIYHELFLRRKNDLPFSCGYAISLNSADQIKRYSHLFSETTRMMMDEFQSETSHYCANEIEKFISVHTSIARGQGEHVRYVPVYLLGNPVSIINPYYTALGISERLRSDTKFLKGDGFVLEQGYNYAAAEAQQESSFNRAFAQNKYTAYAMQGVYLNDNKSFIEKPTGKARYLCTIKYKNVEYAIREFTELGILYCDDKPDATYKSKIAVTTNDHDINYVMLKSNEMFIGNLRYYFDHGAFRFKDLRCKEAVLKTLSY